MARLQVPVQQQVAPGQLPGVQVAAPRVQSGEIVAQQGAALGEAVGQAAQAASRIQLDVMERANALRVNDAMNRLRRDALDLEYGQDGFRARRGEQALPQAFDGRSLTDEYEQRLTRSIDSYDQELGNDAQRALFRANAQQFAQAFRGQAQTHEFQEFRTYGASVLDGGITLAAEEATTAYDNVDRVVANIAQIGALAQERLTEFNGLSGNEVTARVQVLQSAAVMGVIRAAADAGDLSLARNYAELYAETLTAEDRTRYDAMITPALDAELARSVVSDVLAGRDGAPDQAMGAAGAAAEDNPIDVVLEPPFDLRPSSGFGPRVAPRTSTGRGSSNHGGIDYPAPEGSPVPAAGAGRVVFAGERGGYGNLVIVEHPDGRQTYYAHLGEIAVREGQSVDRRTNLGAVGSTGNSSGPHLHFEVRVNGRPVDPRSQLGERNAGAARRADAPQPNQGQPRTRQELEARVLEGLGPRATADQVTAARREIDRTWALRQEAEDQRAAQGLDAAYEALVANGGNFNALPPSVRAAIPADRMDDVVRFSEAISTETKIETPPEIYTLLYDDRELAALSDSEFLGMRGRIATDDWEAAARRRADLRAPARPEGNAANPALVPRDRVNAALDPLLADLGLSRTGTSQMGRAVEARRRAGTILNIVEQTVLAAQQAAGRQLNDAEIRPLVQNLFSRQDVISAGLFGGERAQPLFQTNADQIRRTPVWREIERDFTARGITRPTDSQVEIAYYQRRLRNAR